MSPLMLVTAGRRRRSSLRQSQNGRCVMRRLIDRRVLIVGMLWLLTGCGSSGTSSQGDDGLTMALNGFTGLGIDQADFVNDTTAQVDICPGLCAGGTGGGDIEAEPFTSTFVNAIFVNRGKA